MLPLIVTAGIMRRGHKILIAQRYVKTEHALKWEFPGGKLEEGETPESCLIREIKEELNLTILVDDIFSVVYHAYEDKTVLLLCYLCTYVSGEGKALECNDFHWIDLQEMDNYEFVEADLQIVDKINRQGNKLFELTV
ncbi:MAG: (deoxy)nucleoside triphosphate pyrophosphohydrolase [Bacillota bacterium]